MTKAKNNKTDILASPVFWAVLIIVILSLVVLAVVLLHGGSQEHDPSKQTSTTSVTTTGPVINAEPSESEQIVLDQGLIITDISKYSGKYMEDGTNENVSDVMMLIVKNTNVQDLQLARIDISYDDVTASFQITNLPAGGSVVVLEQNRLSYIDGEYDDIQTRDVVFFNENMSMHEDRFSISSEYGVIKVTNISEEPVSGDIYVYYKNSSSDLFYGGITYRVKITDGLDAGETKSVSAGHYSPDSCKLLMVSFGG